MVSDFTLGLNNCHDQCYHVLHPCGLWLLIINHHSDQIVLLLHLTLDHRGSDLTMAWLTAGAKDFCAAALECIVVDDVANFLHINLC